MSLPTDEAVQQPLRAIVGHCPDCKHTTVIHNDLEVWPLVRCQHCAWTGGVTDLDNFACFRSNGDVELGRDLGRLASRLAVEHD